MTIAAADFRTAFPAFANDTAYPDGQVNFWLGQANTLLDACRWGDSLTYGSMLFAAHNLTLEFMSERAAAVGLPAGLASGPMNHKQVDKVSAGYDTAIASEKDGGAYNLTTYGSRFLRLARLIGAGPVQVGVPGPGDLNGYSSPWYGPFNGY